MTVGQISGKSSELKETCFRFGVEKEEREEGRSFIAAATGRPVPISAKSL
jgi:hypothetical protein